MTAEEILRALITEFDIGSYVYTLQENERHELGCPQAKKYNELIYEAEKLIHANNRRPV